MPSCHTNLEKKMELSPAQPAMLGGWAREAYAPLAGRPAVTKTISGILRSNATISGVKTVAIITRLFGLWYLAMTYSFRMRADREMREQPSRTEPSVQ